MRPTIAAVIIAHNEEACLERCLRSVAWADEIVVVDSESTDRTRQIALAFTPKVTSRAFTDYADQKNHALSLARSEWVLSIDADEEVGEALKNEMLSVLAAPRAEAYRVPRRSHIFGRVFRYTGTQDDAPVRLFKREGARFEQAIHETVRVEGRTGRLTHKLEHYTYDSIKDYLERFNRYTCLEAAMLSAKGIRPRSTDLLLKPPLMFAKLFIFRLGFRDGIEGFIYSVLSAAYVFIKYAKILERSK